MNQTFIEYQPQKVLAAFRQGEFDGLEVIGQANERDFFQRCFQERLLVSDFLISGKQTCDRASSNHAVWQQCSEASLAAYPSQVTGRQTAAS